MEFPEYGYKSYLIAYVEFTCWGYYIHLKMFTDKETLIKEIKSKRFLKEHPSSKDLLVLLRKTHLKWELF